MPGLVEGRLALVTGGSSGIGRATCQVLAREGATVVVTCVDDCGAKTTMETLPGASHLWMKFDVTDKTPVDILDKIFIEYRKYPDILVNCAGIVRFTPPLEETPETFQSIIDVNLKEFCKRLIRNQMAGSIVNVASMTGHRGFEGMSAYAASKLGVEGVTRCLARDMGRYNIRVNDVQPGMIDTAMCKDSPPHMVQDWIDHCTTKRKGRPEEVAEVIVFLASDRASYVNGAHVPVNGGF